MGEKKAVEGKFIEEIVAIAWSARKNGKRTYWFAFMLNLVTALSSAAATVCVAIGGKTFMVGILAALPVAVLGFKNVFKFELKSVWHWQKHHAIEKIRRGVEFEGVSLKEASKRVADVVQKMETSWPGFAVAQRHADSK